MQNKSPLNDPLEIAGFKAFIPNYMYRAFTLSPPPNIHAFLTLGTCENLEGRTMYQAFLDELDSIQNGFEKQFQYWADQNFEFVKDTFNDKGLDKIKEYFLRLRNKHPPSSNSYMIRASLIYSPEVPEDCPSSIIGRYLASEHFARNNLKDSWVMISPLTSTGLSDDFYFRVRGAGLELSDYFPTIQSVFEALRYQGTDKLENITEELASAQLAKQLSVLASRFLRNSEHNQFLTQEYLAEHKKD